MDHHNIQNVVVASGTRNQGHISLAYARRKVKHASKANISHTSSLVSPVAPQDLTSSGTKDLAFSHGFTTNAIP